MNGQPIARLRRRLRETGHSGWPDNRQGARQGSVRGRERWTRGPRWGGPPGRRRSNTSQIFASESRTPTFGGVVGEGAIIARTFSRGLMVPLFTISSDAAKLFTLERSICLLVDVHEAVPAR